MTSTALDAFDDDDGEIVDFATARSRRNRPTEPLKEGEVVPEEWDHEIDTETDPDDPDVIEGEPVPVDPEDGPGTGTATGTNAGLPVWKSRAATERRPIVSPWVKDRKELRSATKWATGHAAHTTAYHAVRTPKYAARVSLRAPVGVAKVVGSTWRWVSDAEARPLRSEAVIKDDPETYLRLAQVRLERIRWRLIVLAVSALVGTLAVVVLLALAPAWAPWLAIAAAVGLLAVLGASGDKPIVDRAEVTPRVRKLSAGVVQRAIISTGLAKDPADIVFPQPISRDGPGWRAVIDLPHGVTSGQVVERRDRLASGLDLSLGQVWPEGSGPGKSLRRLVLWVGDEDLSQSKSKEWPLLGKGSVDLFGEFPFGTDQRGNVVRMCLMFISLLVGAIPRMGKTFSARLAIAAAALDPTVQLHVYDFKGGQDWMPFEKVAHRHKVGDDQEVMDAYVADLRDLVAEQSRRYKVMRSLPSDVCPESKITRELANKKSLGLHPIVMGVDECQRGFENSEHGKEIEALTTDLVKRGPAVGIILVLATQKPDKDSLPSGIRDNIGARFGMRVMSWQVSDMVLGSGMSKAGFNAASLTRADLGIGYLVGASNDVEAQLTRSYKLDTAGLNRVIQRARAAREAAGTLTGQAAGETVETGPEYSILDDIRGVTGSNEPKLWSETVLARLVELRPDFYAGWKPAQLSAALKPYGISTSQVWAQNEDGSGGANKRGITRDDIITAITVRDRKKGIEAD